jgi:hypothetical protein
MCASRCAPGERPVASVLLRLTVVAFVAFVVSIGQFVLCSIEVESADPTKVLIQPKCR